MKTLLIISAFFFSSFAMAQDSAFQLIRTIPIQASDIGVDRLGQIYIVTNTGQIKKFDEKGDSVGVYNEMRRFGKLATIDVSNPLRVLLFYREFSSVVLLDRYLGQKAAIDLRPLNIAQPTAAAISYDNNIWLFDGLENKLIKLDEAGTRQLETPDLRSVFSEGIQPTTIIDQNGSVYLYDPLKGIYVFDYYGSFQRKYPLTSFSTISLMGKQIVGVSKSPEMVFVNLSTLTERKYQFPSSFGAFDKYIFANTRLFALGKDSVNIYSTPF